MRDTAALNPVMKLKWQYCGLGRNTGPRVSSRHLAYAHENILISVVMKSYAPQWALSLHTLADVLQLGPVFRGLIRPLLRASPS